MHMLVCIFLYTYQALGHERRTPFTSLCSSTTNSLGESYAKKSSAEILEKKDHTVSPWKFSYSSFFDCAFNLAELWCVTQQPANFPSLTLTLTFWRWLTRAIAKNRQHVSHFVSTSNDEINLRFCIWYVFSRNLFLLKKRLTPGISWHSWLIRSLGGYKKKLKLKDDGVALRHVYLILVTSDSTLRLVGWLGREPSVQAARNPVCHNLYVFMSKHFTRFPRDIRLRQTNHSHPCLPNSIHEYISTYTNIIHMYRLCMCAYVYLLSFPTKHLKKPRHFPLLKPPFPTWSVWPDGSKGGGA